MLFFVLFVDLLSDKFILPLPTMGGKSVSGSGHLVSEWKNREKVTFTGSMPNISTIGDPPGKFTGRVLSHSGWAAVESADIIHCFQKAACGVLANVVVHKTDRVLCS
jgi:hypothetical protein